MCLESGLIKQIIKRKRKMRMYEIKTVPQGLRKKNKMQREIKSKLIKEVGIFFNNRPENIDTLSSVCPFEKYFEFCIKSSCID